MSAPTADAFVFVGSDSSWASPTDQDVYFADFSVAITENM